MTTPFILDDETYHSREKLNPVEKYHYHSGPTSQVSAAIFLINKSELSKLDKPELRITIIESVYQIKHHKREN